MLHKTNWLSNVMGSRSKGTSICKFIKSFRMCFMMTEWVDMTCNRLGVYCRDSVLHFNVFDDSLLVGRRQIKKAVIGACSANVFYMNLFIVLRAPLF